MKQEIGVVSAIYRYPVKSMAGQKLNSVPLGWHGVDGDRRLAFRRLGVKSGFPWLTASRFPEMIRYRPYSAVTQSNDQENALPTHILTPEGKELELWSAELQAEISNQSGMPVELMQLDQGIFDEAKVSIISASTIRTIEKESGLKLDVSRFRPNILIELTEELLFGEDNWVGRSISIGDSAEAPAVHAYLPDVRCMMINLNPATGEADPAVLKAVVRINDNNAGIYTTVVKTGTLSVGDKLYLQ